MARENPSVPSLISECLGAGTGCMWCVPFLKHLHSLHQQGKEPDLKISPEEYMRTRASYRETKVRDASVVERVTKMDERDQNGNDDQS